MIGKYEIQTLIVVIIMLFLLLLFCPHKCTSLITIEQVGSVCYEINIVDM